MSYYSINTYLYIFVYDMVTSSDISISLLASMNIQTCNITRLVGCAWLI